MKTKKLTLTSGILLVIASSLSIFGLIAVIEELIKTLYFTPINIEENQTYISAYIIMSVYQICLSIAQSIIYMIFGIKMLKRSTPASDGKANKKILIASLVCVSCSLILDPVEIMKLLFIALIPVLACALNFDTKDVAVQEEKPVYLYGTNKNGKDLGGVNLDENGHVVSDKPYAVLGKDGKIEYKNSPNDLTTSKIDVSHIDTKDVNMFDNQSTKKSALEETRIATLNELKNNGIISETEYIDFVSKMVSKKDTETILEKDKPVAHMTSKKTRTTQTTKDKSQKTPSKKTKVVVKNSNSTEDKK